MGISGWRGRTGAKECGEPTADSGMALSRCERAKWDWAEDHRKPTSWRHVVENYLRIAGDRE